LGGREGPKPSPQLMQCGCRLIVRLPRALLASRMLMDAAILIRDLKLFRKAGRYGIAPPR
jgi:hypothetical protein